MHGTGTQLSTSAGLLVQLQGEDLQPPRALEWYPNQLAWHLTFSRTQLRKSPALARIHDLIKRENEAGSITRQEAVSMVPPLFLGVEPHHMVSLAAWGLSMCLLPLRLEPKHPGVGTR